MNYSRRQLEALGETLGECVTRKEGGRIIYGGGGGGGGGTPEKTTQVQDLPEWAKPSAQNVLAKGEALTDINQNPYKNYEGQRIAGFTNLQNQAFQGAQGMQTSPQLGQAAGISGLAADRALNTTGGYNPYQAQMLTAQAPGLNQYQMGPAQMVRSDMFGDRQAAQYMSPYIEQALAPQLRELARQSDIQRNQSQAQAVAQGAFGGSRQAIVEAERQRNLGIQQGDVLNKGYQTAYEQAANQFNQDAARRLQAGLANQQAGLNVGTQNLNALLSTQQLGANQSLQAQLANQGAYQQANQLAEQSRQFGSNLGLQGLQTALQGANQLGQLGQQQFLQNMDINKLQAQYGAQQQQQDQAQLSQQYQDFMNQQRYPYQQLEFMSNLLRGTPMGTVNTLYSPQPSLLGQIGGAGVGLYGLSKMASGMKAGGVTDVQEKPKKSKPAGLAELAFSKI